MLAVAVWVICASAATAWSKLHLPHELLCWQVAYVNQHTRERQEHKPTDLAPTLPAGWQLIPSRSRAGMYSFLNSLTQERQKHIPTSPAAVRRHPPEPATGEDDTPVADLADLMAGINIDQTAAPTVSSVKQIKAELVALGVSFNDLVEKNELVERLAQAKKQTQSNPTSNPTATAPANPSPGAADVTQDTRAPEMTPYHLILDTCILLDDRE
jgi:hypothetical protein